MEPGRTRQPRWVVVGYVATAAWMVFVAAETQGDLGHPLSDALFLVPLAGWIVAVIAARVGAAWRRRKGGGS